MIFLLKFVFILVEQSVQNFLCRLFYQWIHSLAEPTTSPAKYSGLHFAHKPSVLLSHLLPKFSPAMAGNIYCNFSLFYLPKDDKKAVDIFFYHRLKTQVLSFSFCYIKHLRFVFADKKIRAISVALNGSFFARILIPIYLIFSRFYLKNRITTKPTSKSLVFNDFNARRGIATLNCNSMVNDGNCPVRIHKRERTIGQSLHAR